VSRTQLLQTAIHAQRLLLSSRYRGPVRSHSSAYLYADYAVVNHFAAVVRSAAVIYSAVVIHSTALIYSTAVLPSAAASSFRSRAPVRCRGRVRIFYVLFSSQPRVLFSF
jgi:hypothetical protein